MKNITQSSIFALMVFFAIPALSHAATLDMNIGSDAYDLHDIFSVDVYLNANSDAINALAGTVYFDTDNLILVETTDADSIVNFWIEKTVSDGDVTFSGIIPGGFRGEHGKVITLVFETVASGEASVGVRDVTAFLNDGLGTKEALTPAEKELDISKKISQNTNQNRGHASDVYPPESFKPEVSQAESLFDSKWFLVFSTTDKDSGVSHYLIKEARFRALMFFKRWAQVESPYVLRDQSRTSFIAIKAVDKAGNEVVEKVYPQNPKTLLERIIVILSLSVAGILILFLLKKVLKGMKDNLEEA